jgi:predicted phosphodiesterase
MTCYAFVADIHGCARQLGRVLEDAQRRGVTHLVDLGDTGTDACHAMLARAKAQAVFGNYEVTQWDRLSPANQERVRGLGPMLIGETFLAAHAAPYMPAALNTVDEALDYVLENRVKWDLLFPRLDRDPDARWKTWAELETRRKCVFFHGHTHRQMIWRIGPSGAMTLLGGANSWPLDPRARYIVGVGSVGKPEEGPAPQYVIYDPNAQTLTLRRGADRSPPREPG